MTNATASSTPMVDKNNRPVNKGDRVLVSGVVVGSKRGMLMVEIPLCGDMTTILHTQSEAIEVVPNTPMIGEETEKVHAA